VCAQILPNLYPQSSGKAEKKDSAQRNLDSALPLETLSVFQVQLNGVLRDSHPIPFPKEDDISSKILSTSPSPEPLW